MALQFALTSHKCTTLYTNQRDNEDKLQNTTRTNLAKQPNTKGSETNCVSS
jgi:hypothetical protein